MRENEAANANKFDLKTHHFDPKGKLLGVTPYRLHVKNGAKLFERPVGSGNLFHENMEQAGRMIYNIDDQGKTSKRYDAKAKHIVWQAPESGDELLAREASKVRQENEELRRELEAIRAEKSGGKTAAEVAVEPEVAVAVAAKEPEAEAEAKKPKAVTDVKKPTSNYKDML